MLALHSLLLPCPPPSPQVQEFDTPSSLLNNPGSMFNKLVEDTGAVASAALRRMAAAGPEDDEDAAVTRRSMQEVRRSMQEMRRSMEVQRSAQ